MERYNLVLVAKNCAASAHQWAPETQTSWRIVTCLSPLLEFAGMFHMRGLSCHWSLKWYSIILYWWFCELPAHFCLWNLWWDDLTKLPPYMNHGNDSEVLFPWHCQWMLFRAFHVFLVWFSWVWNIVPSDQPLDSYGTHLTCTTANTYWEAAQRTMAENLTRLGQKIAVVWLLVVENCTICHSWF